jgi:hypothetical protein
MLAEQSLNLIVALAMIATLLALGRTRREFFLTRGDLAAPVAPIRWLGVGLGQRWNRFALWLTLCASGGTLAFLVIAGGPDPDDASRSQFAWSAMNRSRISLTRLGWARAVMWWASPTSCTSMPGIRCRAACAASSGG